MEIELHRLRQHLTALSLVLGQPKKGDVAQLLAYLDADINEAEATWSQFRSAFTQLDKLPKLTQTNFNAPNTNRRREMDKKGRSS